MPSKCLLKSQKNEVFRILQEIGLDPANFEWGEEISIDGDSVISKLGCYDEDFLITFDFYSYSGEENYYLTFRPGEDRAIQEEQIDDWKLALRYVYIWAACVKREIDAPDLWAEIGKYKNSISLAIPEDVSENPIPAFEVEEIEDRLSKLSDTIIARFDLQEDESKFVRQKLNYLSESAKKQPRRDWQLMLIGSLVSIAFNLALDSEKAKLLWQLAKDALNSVIYFLGD